MGPLCRSLRLCLQRRDCSKAQSFSIHDQGKVRYGEDSRLS
jgi:hypothetical protein